MESHGTGGHQLSVQQKQSNGECCLGEHCVRSWISYGLKWGIPWKFIPGFSLFLLISFLPNVSKKYYRDTGEDQFYAQQ